MATKKTTATENIAIPAINIQEAAIRLIGDTPLIVHAWSDKAKQQILDKQMKKASNGKEAKNPIEDVINSLYWLDGKPEEYTEDAFAEAIRNGAHFGFPSTAFKAAAVSAAYRAGAVKNMVTMNGAFHITGEYIEVKGTPHPREDMVRIAMGGTDIRFRGEFDAWEVTVHIRYNATAFSLPPDRQRVQPWRVCLRDWRVAAGKGRHKRDVPCGGGITAAWDNAAGTARRG